VLCARASTSVTYLLIWSPLSEKDFDQIRDYLSINWEIKVVTCRFMNIAGTYYKSDIRKNPKQYLPDQ
ncbi:MAG: hypothetical protein U5L72_03355, partial [Bacteroidales bacterium]|nr:hypothetical protein [Bacteroidales bacterium]